MYETADKKGKPLGSWRVKYIQMWLYTLMGITIRPQFHKHKKIFPQILFTFHPSLILEKFSNFLTAPILFTPVSL